MLSDEEKEALEILKAVGIRCKGINIDEVIINLIKKQQKTIDEMAGYLAIIRDCPNENCGANLDCENRCNNDDDLVEECWKMYFERKIKDE